MGLALGLSVDCALVGIIYAAHNLRIPPVSLGLVTLCTGILLFLSMVAGEIASLWIPPQATHYLGGCILIFMGLWQCVQNGSKEEAPPSTNVGLLKQILAQPASADRDNSGVIDIRESLFLGLALGADALGAGLGASLTGFSWIVIPAASVCSALFLLLGSRLGRWLNLNGRHKKMKPAAGFALALLGLLKILGCL